MSSGIKKLIWVTVVVVPLVVGVFFFLPAARENSSLQKEKQALQSKPVAPEQFADLARNKGAQVTIKNDRVVITANYDLLLPVIEDGLQRGYVPSAISRKRAVLIQE